MARRVPEPNGGDGLIEGGTPIRAVGGGQPDPRQSVIQAIVQAPPSGRSVLLTRQQFKLVACPRNQNTK